MRNCLYSGYLRLITASAGGVDESKANTQSRSRSVESRKKTAWRWKATETGTRVGPRSRINLRRTVTHRAGEHMISVEPAGKFFPVRP